MDQSKQRRTRLAQLLELAQTYKGWTRKELAKSLGRDPTKLIPGSGVPKLDFVVDLAGVLDWPVQDVVDHLWPNACACPANVRNGAGDLQNVESDFDALDAAARDAYRQGSYREMVDIAKRAFAIATTPEERARACNRENAAWDGLGRYQKVLDAVQRGLMQHPVSPEFRRMLQSNLANAYYNLWSLVEARAIARDLIAGFDGRPPTNLRDRKTLAFSHYVSGHTFRRLITVEPDRCDELAVSARQDLEIGRLMYEELAREFEDDSYGGIANTCAGGIIEVDVALGRKTPEAALEELSAGLDCVSEVLGHADSDRLESFGWWCIFGCNIALRYLTDERQLQQHMAVFTNKADEIASELDDWSIRERVFTMEHSRWERAVGCTGFDIPRVVDEEDVRIIAGTMARFPTFQSTGWEILRSARVVRAN